MSSGGERNELDPEVDLIDRYDTMIEIQIETINDIDDKAAFTGRLIAILGGLIVTAASVSAGTDVLELSRTTVGTLFMLFVGTTALFVSLLFAIITYLNSKFVYGPTASLGKYMVKHRVDSQHYRDGLIRGYSAGIDANKRVVEENSKRFKWCLTTLLQAILFLYGAGVLFVLPDTPGVDLIIIAVFSLIGFFLSLYIIRGNYLTLEGVSSNNE